MKVEGAGHGLVNLARDQHKLVTSDNERDLDDVTVLARRDVHAADLAHREL